MIHKVRSQREDMNTKSDRGTGGKEQIWGFLSATVRENVNILSGDNF